MVMADIALFSFLSVGAIAVAVIASVAIYTSARRREREAFYRAETLKKLAEVQGVGAQAVLDVIREQEAVIWRRIREGLKIGGLAASGAGAGLLIAFSNQPHAGPIG